MRLGEERLGIARDQRFLVEERWHPRGQDVGLRHARLFRLDALHPYPDESLRLTFAAHRDGERRVAGTFFGAWQSQGNPADISERRQWQLIVRRSGTILTARRGATDSIIAAVGGRCGTL